MSTDGITFQKANKNIVDVHIINLLMYNNFLGNATNEIIQSHFPEVVKYHEINFQIKKNISRFHICLPNHRLMHYFELSFFKQLELLF